jgi:multidrug efflux system outer membrane protein
VLAGQGAEIDQALASARRSADLAQKLYDAGRSRLPGAAGRPAQPGAVERTAVQLRGDRAVTTVALIRALGGGWDAAPASDASAASVALASK